MPYEIDLPTDKSTAFKPSVESDESLMVLIQRGDDQALGRLYGRHYALLRSIIGKVVHEDFDVDDVMQEVLIELWNRASYFEAAKGKPLGWLVTLARRRAIDRVRRRTTYSRMEERNRQQVEAEAPRFEMGADVGAENSDRAEIFKNVLSGLPEPQRTALELAFYGGLSQREIARKIGVPLGTVKTRLELGVRKVRAAVLAMGGAAEWSCFASRK